MIIEEYIAIAHNTKCRACNKTIERGDTCVKFYTGKIDFGYLYYHLACAITDIVDPIRKMEKLPYPHALIEYAISLKEYADTRNYIVDSFLFFEGVSQSQWVDSLVNKDSLVSDIDTISEHLYRSELVTRPMSFANGLYRLLDKNWFSLGYQDLLQAYKETSNRIGTRERGV